MGLPRGIRNHNASNIEHQPANKWQGLADPPSDGRFCVFKSEVWGLRALAVLLIRYYDKYDCDTTAKIINRWAPPVENDTGAYAAAVAKRLKRGPHDPVNLHEYADLLAIMKGIVTHENGNPKPHGKPQDWYPQETYDEALKRAGVVSKAETKRTTNDVAQGAAAATVSVAGAWEAGKGLLAVNSERAQSIGATVLFIAMAISVVAWWRHNKRRRAERL
jgi:hypothetical protein